MKNFIHSIFLSEKVIFGLISLNAFIIFIQGFPDDTLGAGTSQVFAFLDDFISVLFVVEVLVKGFHFGFREYLKPAWNKFDVVLILLSLPPLLVRFIPVGVVANFSFLLVFRVFRIFKFFRFIQFFPQVEQIFRSIQGAMSASIMVLLGFIVFIFITAILSCYFYQSIAPQHFGDPITSYYTMFKIFTIEGWNAIPDELVASGKLGILGSFFTKLYFVTILVFGGIIGLSIVNSIFVDAMISNNSDTLEMEGGIQHIQEKLVEMETKMDKILNALGELEDKSKGNNNPNIS